MDSQHSASEPQRNQSGAHQNEMPAYYRQVYKGWYDWFSIIFDLFVKSFCFALNGGFGGERRWRGQIVDWLDPQPGEKIIDMCCGTGTLGIMIAKRLTGTGEVIGIDLSSALIRKARAKRRPANLTLIEGDAQQVPYPDGYFDRVTICGALHEMPRQVRLNVLREARRLLKPGGRIVSVEHAKPKQRWRAVLYDFLERFNPEYPTYKDLLRSGLRNEIEQSGFRVEKSDTIASEYLEIILAESASKCDTNCQLNPSNSR